MLLIAVAVNLIVLAHIVSCENAIESDFILDATDKYRNVPQLIESRGYKSESNLPIVLCLRTLS